MLQQEPASATKASERQNVAAPTPPAPNLPARRFADEEQFEEQRRGRRSTWIAILATPFLLLLAYVGMLWAARGDYVYSGLAPFHSQRFALDPLPRWSYMSPGGDQVGGYYWIDFRGLSFVQEANAYQDWTVCWERRSRLESIGGPHYRHAGARTTPGLDAQAQSTERFPPGTLDGLRTAAAGESVESALAAAREIERDFPKRATPKFWVVSLTAQAGQLQEAKRLLKAWRPFFEAETEPRGREYLAALEGDFRACEPDAARLRRAVEALFPGSIHKPVSIATAPTAYTPPTGALAWFTLDEWIEQVEALEIEKPALFPSFQARLSQDYLARDRLLLALRKRAFFFAVDGRRERAVALLEKGWLLGPRGAAARGRFYASDQAEALEPLEWLLLESSTSAEQAESDWRALERLAAANEWGDRESYFRDLFPGHKDPFPLSEYHSGLAGRGGFAVAIASALVRDARLQLLREGLRVRHYRLTRGEWPAIGADGAALGLELATAGPPILDPCAIPPRPFRAEIVGEKFRLRSFGPDEKDDGCASNLGRGGYGSWLGDVFVELDAEPRYDFPSDPGHEYADFEEFARRYPGGFPVPDLVSSRSVSSSFPTAPALYALWFDPAAKKTIVWSEEFSFLGGLSENLVASSGPGPLYDPRLGVEAGGALSYPLNVANPARVEELSRRYTPFGSIPPLRLEDMKTKPPSEWKHVRMKPKPPPIEAAAAEAVSAEIPDSMSAEGLAAKPAASDAEAPAIANEEASVAADPAP